MNTRQIDGILEPRVKNYIGTFSSDNLPHEPGIFVSNTDPHHLPGTHWIAIYISADRQRGEYFDSFGRPPNKHFKNYMNGHCRHWIRNKRQLQSVASKLCGYYCVLYCLCRGRSIDMISFVNRFTRDTGFNDAIVGKALKLNKR
jgi:hypothetical protein